MIATGYTWPNEERWRLSFQCITCEAVRRPQRRGSSGLAARGRSLEREAWLPAWLCATWAWVVERNSAAWHAHSSHRDQPIRLIVITDSGDRDHAAGKVEEGLPDGMGGIWSSPLTVVP